MGIYGQTPVLKTYAGSMLFNAKGFLTFAS